MKITYYYDLTIYLESFVLIVWVSGLEQTFFAGAFHGTPCLPYERFTSKFSSTQDFRKTKVFVGFEFNFLGNVIIFQSPVSCGPSNGLMGTIWCSY